MTRCAGDELLRVLLGAAHSDGALGIVELEMAAGSAGPPLHLHPTHGEGFSVFAGRPSLQVDDRVATGGDEWPDGFAVHGPCKRKRAAVSCPSTISGFPPAPARTRDRTSTGFRPYRRRGEGRPGVPMP